jgi:hypothetical protein
MTRICYTSWIHQNSLGSLGLAPAVLDMVRVGTPRWCAGPAQGSVPVCSLLAQVKAAGQLLKAQKLQ